MMEKISRDLSFMEDKIYNVPIATEEVNYQFEIGEPTWHRTITGPGEIAQLDYFIDRQKRGHVFRDVEGQYHTIRISEAGDWHLIDNDPTPSLGLAKAIVERAVAEESLVT